MVRKFVCIKNCVSKFSSSLFLQFILQYKQLFLQFILQYKQLYSIKSSLFNVYVF